MGGMWVYKCLHEKWARWLPWLRRRPDGGTETEEQAVALWALHFEGEIDSGDCTLRQVTAPMRVQNPRHWKSGVWNGLVPVKVGLGGEGREGRCHVEGEADICAGQRLRKDRRTQLGHAVAFRCDGDLSGMHHCPKRLRGPGAGSGNRPQCTPHPCVDSWGPGPRTHPDKGSPY